MKKLDLTKEYKNYYAARKKPQIIHLEKAQYLSICGVGDPSGNLFSEHIQALYATSYAIKFISKEVGNDFVVPKLEGLWDFDNEKYGVVSMEEAPIKIPREDWKYRLMIRMPEFVTKNMIENAKEEMLRKKDIKYIDELEFFTLEEGKVIQMLHVGPFENEPESLKLIRDFALGNQLEKNGLHHEIYLSDFRRTAPDRLKTILREPVK